MEEKGVYLSGKFVMKRRNPLVEKINHEKEENIHIVRKFQNEEENNLCGRSFTRKSRKCTFVDNHEEEKARNLLRGKRKRKC